MGSDSCTKSGSQLNVQTGQLVSLATFCFTLHIFADGTGPLKARLLEQRVTTQKG